MRNINLNWWPVIILNIGGISNATSVSRLYPKNVDSVDLKRYEKDYKLFAEDIGPGNCLIDEWIRKNSKYKFDQNGSIAKSGKINQLTLNQAIFSLVH